MGLLSYNLRGFPFVRWPLFISCTLLQIIELVMVYLFVIDIVNWVWNGCTSIALSLVTFKAVTTVCRLRGT
jgi:hypothetical protein